jgi:hypothetical protein
MTSQIIFILKKNPPRGVPLGVLRYRPKAEGETRESGHPSLIAGTANEKIRARIFNSEQSDDKALIHTCLISAN